MLSVSLGDIFERLLAWEDDDPCPINIKNKSKEECLLSVSELTVYIMSTGLDTWQTSEMNSYKPTANIFDIPQPRRCPSSLPYSTVAVDYGSDLAMEALPVAQVRPFSFHIPLHRFVAVCLREVARRPNARVGTEKNKDVTNQVGKEDGIHLVLTSLLSSFGSQRLKRFLRGLVEFPVIVLSRVAQIRSGLWKRNGYCMSEQVGRYDEQEYCRSMKDADLMLLQFAIIAHQALHSFGSVDDTYVNDAGCAYITNLLLHRFGLFDFAGFDKSPNSDTTRYLEEVKQGLYQGEVRSNNSDALVLPWTYTPAKEPSSFLALLEQLLQLFIVLITELPSPYPRNRSEEAIQAKMRLRREVIHKLVSGPKLHSELTEVYLVLSKRDNSILSEEGKLANPDDAMGAALEEALSEVADRKASRGKGGAQQWELRRHAWSEYDPSFYHMSLKAHQIAAEKRPYFTDFGNPSATTAQDASTSIILPGYTSTPPPEPYAPHPPPSHLSFSRIRRDFTSDATVISLVYRTLHVHCHKAGNKAPEQIKVCLRGKDAYDRKAMSERVLAHTIQLLTLGAYAWQEQTSTKHWRSSGGGGKGSIFYHTKNTSPTISDWIRSTLLADPCDIMKSDWYSGEECSLLLLRRLAHDGGNVNGFAVQDAALRSGAMWLCTFAAEHSLDAAALLNEHSLTTVDESVTDSVETERERRIRMARERFERIEAANKMKINALVPSNEDSVDESGRNEDNKDVDEKSRLMKEKPQCPICYRSDENTANGQNCNLDTEASDGEENNNALAFCGYVQPSLVLKGGGGLPQCSGSQANHYGPSSYLNRLVGTHITICGHSLHSVCSNFHSKIGNHHDEFQCPMCKRLCNCLVPFVDIGVDWIDKNEEGAQNVAHDHRLDTLPDDSSIFLPPRSMHDFLSCTHWWDSCRVTQDTNITQIPAANSNSPISPFSHGATNVYRKLMDLIDGVSREADIKRLGEDQLMRDPGEFRYRVGEDMEDDTNNRAIWDNTIEWPPMNSSRTSYEQRLSKEKLLSRLLLSVQAFTYTCCSEATEIRRRTGQECEDQERMYSKFGVYSVEFDGKLVVLPEPSSTEDDGHQPFRGRFGKLRHLALSIMVAASSISQEIVQNLLDLPVQEDISCVRKGTKQYPSVYPVLCGHILSHTVAVMFAACGKAWVQNDSVARTRMKSGESTSNDTSDTSTGITIADTVFRDCEAFIGLGFLARVLQVFFGSIQQAAGASGSCKYHHLEKTLTKSMGGLPNRNIHYLSNDDEWQCECGLLVKIALSGQHDGPSFPDEKDATDYLTKEDIEQFIADASAEARKAGIEFLLDAAVALQVLAPGWSASNGMLHINGGNGVYNESTTKNVLSILMKYCRIEPIVKMLESPLVCEVVTGWYKALRTSMALSKRNKKNNLDYEKVFRTLDWPMPASTGKKNPIGQDLKLPTQLFTQGKYAKNEVPLLGGVCTGEDCSVTDVHRTSIEMLPLSYTDLYAKLGTLCEFEQTALCMVCGQVLNACLDRECVEHTYQCGAGSGVFFLLQKCVVLITHNSREAYIQSPYVDSHGETSQYSGRPLNLDMDRYDILREMWCGHQIYERVISEQRGN